MISWRPDSKSRFASGAMPWAPNSFDDKSRSKQLRLTHFATSSAASEVILRKKVNVGKTQNRRETL